MYAIPVSKPCITGPASVVFECEPMHGKRQECISSEGTLFLISPRPTAGFCQVQQRRLVHNTSFAMWEPRIRVVQKHKEKHKQRSWNIPWHDRDDRSVQTYNSWFFGMHRRNHKPELEAIWVLAIFSSSEKHYFHLGLDSQRQHSHSPLIQPHIPAILSCALLTPCAFWLHLSMSCD